MESPPVTNPEIRTTNSRQNSVFHTRTLMTVAAISVVGTLIVVPLTYVSMALQVSPGGILAVCGFLGGWMFPYLLPGAVTRKPGAILIASLLIGIISAFVTPMGPAAILGNLIAGLLLEIPLAVLLYRHWDWLGYGLGAVLFGMFNAVSYSSFVKIPVTTTQMVGFFVTAVVSCLLGVALTKLVVAGLRRAGIGIEVPTPADA